MLHSLLPKAHHRYLSLPLLGPITDSFDDWLHATGYTCRSREFMIRMLPLVDTDLRCRQVDEIGKLNPTVLDNCWKALKKKYPSGSGTVRTVQRYLVTTGLIVDDRQATPSSLAWTLSEEYAKHLREVRGFAAFTISEHRRTTQYFLQHLEATGSIVGAIGTSIIESYITKAGTRLNRASLQHEIAAIRGFLRFLSTDGRIPAGGLSEDPD